MQLLLKTQQFLAKNRQMITTLFITFELAVIIGWFLIYFTALTDYPSVVGIIFKYGKKLGEISLILYCLTLIPGIISRLQWLPSLTRPIGSSIMIYRRHIGILMFLLAFVHMTFTTFLPYYALFEFNPPGFPPFATHQVASLITMALLFPMWLTSNDYSQKKLGKWWKRLHRLTYLAMFGIFGHVALQTSKWAVVIGVFVLLEAISWFVYWRREAAKKAAVI
ncbi:MAG: hypothetical protein COY81_03845 [Candidatus Pacebacteria bacterium CG_4_10_14_0_8_um_filter_43_12]|nr:MAG: hypothetical protein COU66_00790 [Candidatus Pacebacteria bacterium CG10_big_fil_rev_8_21_14_0_10_44_11]PIY79216.1 MAG: hypothetical protein COY81_03845 [Candidatus Pacebacteria bacterium CG_4_10_14_0_8_um_filter_43_12]